MTRLAIIISNPGEIGAENYCKGVDVDVRTYTNFLISPIGGAWKANEVIHLPRPDISSVRAAITRAQLVDYALIIFAGHGYYDQYKRSTQLVLKKFVEIDENDLKKGAKKQTVILDCCRQPKPSSILEKKTVLSFAEDRKRTLNPALSRMLFDSMVGNASPGLITIYSCSVGETAADDDTKGGMYSYTLLENASDWAKEARNPSFRSIVESHDSTAAIVKIRTGDRQNPVVVKPRGGVYFPFVIVA